MDTANSARVDDERFLNAAYRLKIDHHIYVETFADVEIIQDLKGATCEILADMFMQKGIRISALCAQYLYGGLIADTLRFSISTMTPDTFHVAAYLLTCGVDVAKANEDNFSTSLRLYRYENYIRANCSVLEEKLAYMIVSKEDYEHYGLTFDEAKEKYLLWVVYRNLKHGPYLLKKNEMLMVTQSIMVACALAKKRSMILPILIMVADIVLPVGIKGLKKDDINRLLQDLLKRIDE